MGCGSSNDFSSSGQRVPCPYCHGNVQPPLKMETGQGPRDFRRSIAYEIRDDDFSCPECNKKIEQYCCSRCKKVQQFVEGTSSFECEICGLAQDAIKVNKRKKKKTSDSSDSSDSDSDSDSDTTSSSDSDSDDIYAFKPSGKKNRKKKEKEELRRRRKSEAPAKHKKKKKKKKH